MNRELVHLEEKILPHMLVSALSWIHSFCSQAAPEQRFK